ncbi:hypothetical protein FXW07_02360 [Methanosarcina sp. DH1]|nr:hypothetical protein [Methanosarcina sp. DH1]
MSVSDVRHTFGSLTTPSLYYAGGGGQETMPGNPLPQPFEVYVTNGSVPVEGAWVKFAFKTKQGNGQLVDSSDNTNESASWIKIRTNSNGIASCYCTPNSLKWNTDSSIWHQQVEAVLLDADCGVTGNVPPVHFNASLSVAGDVAYKLPDCTASYVTCDVVSTSYQYWSGEQYPLIELFGEKYVPLLAKNDPIWKSHINKLSKLVRDDNEKYTLKTGEILDLGEGYTLEAKQVDVDGKKVWLEFTRDGKYIGDEIIDVGTGDNNWDVELNGIQDEDNVVVFRVHVNQVFQGAVDSIVQIDGLWLIDYANVMTLKIGETLGEYTITNIIDGINSFNPGSLIFYHDCTASYVTCNVVSTSYQYLSGEQYPLIELFGEKYVPLIAKDDPIWKSRINKLAKLVRDDDEKYAFKAGDMFDLGEGYTLEAKQVDIDGKKVWLEFTRDGKYIGDEIIDVGTGDSTWDVVLNGIQDEDNVVVFRVHVNQVFQGAVDSIVQIDGLWLIDYANVITLEVGDEFGEFTLIKSNDGVDVSNPGSLIFEGIANQANEFPTVQKLLKQKISGWPPEDKVGNVSVKGILDTLLCKLDAGKIPYNPLINENRWKDINETSDLGEPPAPNTVQDALDNLAANLDSSDISYRPREDCPSSLTVRSLLEIPLNKDSKVNEVFDALLCNFNAAYLPLDLSDGNLCKKLLEVKTVQDALKVLCGEIGGVGGAGCCIIVQDSKQLQEALKKLKDGSTICLLAGEYSNIKELLISDRKNIVIRGCNLASKLFTNIKITDCQNVVLENLDISGNIFVGNVIDFSMKGNVISQVNDQIFEVAKCQGIIMESNLFTVKSQKGLVFEALNDLKIHKNRINIDLSNTEIKELSSIFVANSSDIEITNNLIQISDSEGISEKVTVIGMRLEDTEERELEGNVSVISNTVNAINAPSLNIKSKGSVRVHGNIFKSTLRSLGQSDVEEGSTVNIESPEKQIIFTNNLCYSYSIRGPVNDNYVYLIGIKGRDTIFSNNNCDFTAKSYEVEQVTTHVYIHIPPKSGFSANVIGNRCSENIIDERFFSIFAGEMPGVSADKQSILLGNITQNVIRPETQNLNLRS